MPGVNLFADKDYKKIELRGIDREGDISANNEYLTSS